MSQYGFRNVSDLFKKTDVITSHEINVLSYTPGKVEENKPLTEVHILATAFKFPKMAFVVRLKSREVCQELINALKKHMDDVWPGGA